MQGTGNFHKNIHCILAAKMIKRSLNVHCILDVKMTNDHVHTNITAKAIETLQQMYLRGRWKITQYLPQMHGNP